MPEPPSLMTIVEALRSIGFPEGRLTYKELAHGWRIRAAGGLVVHLRKNGELTISGRSSNNLRKALGLAGQRKNKRLKKAAQAPATIPLDSFNAGKDE